MPISFMLVRCPGINVLAMQETWDTTHAKVMPGYKLISKSRTSKHGGGVGFLILSETAFKQN
jgi:hypothetical protein